MQPITIRDHAQGELHFKEERLDVTFGKDSTWTGPGANRLNAALANGSRFVWPVRADMLQMVGVSAEFGNLTPIMVDKKMDAREAKVYADAHWPPSQRGSHLPTEIPFVLKASAGARITGRILLAFA